MSKSIDPYPLLSQSAEYALRAVLYIAQEDMRLSAETVARTLDIPRNYLSKILHMLVREGVLESGRGRLGGFALALPAEELTLGRVVGPFEDHARRRVCLLEQASCSDAQPCEAHAQWRMLSGQVSSFFNDTTVSALLTSERRCAIGLDVLNSAAKGGQDG